MNLYRQKCGNTGIFYDIFVRFWGKDTPLKHLFFIKTGECDRGVAWHEEAEETSKPYLRVALDDPSFCKTGMAMRLGSFFKR